MTLLHKTFAKNLCNFLWDKKLCNFFSVKLTTEDFNLLTFSSNHDRFLIFSVNLTKFATLCKIPSIWRKSAKLFIPWDVAKVFCKAFCPMGKKALQKINLTEKLKLQRKFLPDSLFSKPYRNNNFLTPFLKKVSHWNTQLNQKLFSNPQIVTAFY